MWKSILKTATFKQSQITIAATFINGLFGAAFYIISARFLGPSNFGLLTVSVATLTLIADIVDFGTNTGLVRFVSANEKVDKDKTLKILKLSLEFKIIVWIAVLILGYFLSPILALSLFNKTELIVPLRLVMFGVGGALLLSFATSALQAFQKYFIWSIVNIATNLLRLLLVILLLLYGKFDLFSGLFSYILLPFFGFSMSLFFLPSKKIFNTKNELSVGRQLLSYNFWVGIFTIIAAISARLDTFLSARLLSSFNLGIYGAANQLVQIVPQIVGALGTVTAPKFASFTNIKDMILYLKKFQIFVLGLSVLGLLTIPIAIYLIPQFFGKEYALAINPFIILFLAMLIFLISVPVHTSIIFYFGRPDIFVWVSFLHLIIMGFLGFILISNFGIVGAAFTVLVGTIFSFVAPLGWLLIKISK